MRRIFLFVWMLFTAILTQAQELAVTYRVAYDRQSPDLFADVMPNEEMRSSLINAYKDVTFDYLLTYKDNESDFRLILPKEKIEVTFMGRTMDIVPFLAQQAHNYTYKNHAEGVILDKSSVFGKDFLVIDSTQNAHFTLHPNETKTILGFECVKAVSSDGKTTAWITRHIPLKDEPIATGLEGLVLEFDNGQQTFTATDIQDKATQPIVRPQGGKPITQKEFKEMVKKRVEMMKRNEQGL